MPSLSLWGMAYIPYGFRRKGKGENPHSFRDELLIKLTKYIPNARTQALIKRKAAFTIVLNSMPSSLPNAHAECPAEGVSRRYLIKRKLFHFNTP